MANNIFEKDHKILYNSVPDQRLTYANQLTVKNWNDIINILKVQANINADYLEKLHTWFIGNYDPTKSFEENIVSIPGDKNFVEYILELIEAAESELERLNKIKADTQYVDFADEEISRRIDQVEQTKADTTYVDTKDEKIIKKIDSNTINISTNTQNVNRLIEHVTSINNSITSLTNRVGTNENDITTLNDNINDLYLIKADTQYVDEKFEQLLGEGANETLDTIGEIAKALEEHDDEYDSLLAVVGNKADKSEIPTKASQLEQDVSVNANEVLDIIEENGAEVSRDYSIGTSDSYNVTNDKQIITTKAVKSIIDNKLLDYYTIIEIHDLLKNLNTLNFKIVDGLPTTNISTSTIYLLPYENEYKEYIYINSAWEMLGITKINLSEYALKTEIPTKLSQLEQDIEVGGSVSEEDVINIIEENGEEVEQDYSIGTSSNYDATNDNQLVTAKAVKSMIDNTITSALEGDY